MIFSKERITLAIAMLMFVIGVMPSLYIFNLRLDTVMEQFNGKLFNVPYQMNESIMDPITCPTILVAGETIQVRAKVNIPEDLLSDYDIYVYGNNLSDGSIVTKGVNDWRELVQIGEGKSQFLWLVTVPQPGIYQYGVYAFNRLDEQNPYFPYMWGNSDREECFLPVINRIGFTGKQILAINQFWIAIFLIAGLGICVWWFFTYPSHRRITMTRLLTFLPFLLPFYGVYIFLYLGAFSIPFGIFALLAMVIPLIMVFLTIPKGQ